MQLLACCFSTHYTRTALFLTTPHIRREPVAETILQLFERLLHGLASTVFKVMQRSAAKWSETGAEDDPGIHHIGILNHPLAQAGDGLVDQPQDQAFL